VPGQENKEKRMPRFTMALAEEALAKPCKRPIIAVGMWEIKQQKAEACYLHEMLVGH
jgi:hypothetical protein